MKVYIIPHPPNFYKDYSCPRGEKIVLDGLKAIPDVLLIDDLKEADIIILDYVPHKGKEKYNKEFINQFDVSKLVVIDWQDEVESPLVDNCLAYFKRSWVLPQVNENGVYIRREKIDRPANYFPFAYCCLNEYFGSNPNYFDRNIDIGCYLRPDSPNRIFVLSLLNIWKKELWGLNIVMGPVSSGSRSMNGQVYIDKKYFSALSNTRILITCNPWWEGDMRLWEALASGCLVFVDKMFTSIPKKLIDKIHVVEYDLSYPLDLLAELKYYINNIYSAERIAVCGNEFVKKHHMPVNRMQYVIDVVKGLL